jgi:hypothetical protein
MSWCSDSSYSQVLGSVGALALLAFYPPTAQVGAVGWAIALPGALFSLLLGALTLALRIRLRPRAVYVTSLIGMAQIGLLQYLSGSGRAPFIQLLLLPALGAPASQSPRRCAQVLLTIGAVGASPLLG